MRPLPRFASPARASRTLLAALAAVVLVLSGCATTGQFSAQNITNVQLTEANYDVIATGVSGEASAYYLLGLSVNQGAQANTFAVARLSGDGLLYEAAFADLWANFEAEYGATDDRSLALVNVRFDSDPLNLFVVTRPKVSIRADVVEFN
jgi:hypothetical protein